MKKISLFILLVLGISCSNNGEDIFDENFTRGGFIEFLTAPETTSFNVLDIQNLSFTADVIDPNSNATSYSLTMMYGDVSVVDFLTLTSFPSTMEITGQDILSALNFTSAADFDISIPLVFVATVTTPTGVFVGRTPDFDNNTNTSNGGNTAIDIFGAARPQAMNFAFTLFLPPPKKLRGTSFESPFGVASGSDYTRPDADADADGELLNNSGERHVMHTATGTGVDDEIGFRTEFISTGDGGFTSEEIGVTTSTNEFSAYPEGVQGYQLEDVDGTLRLTFDRVEVDATANPASGARIQFFPRSTSWESGDSLVISILVERAGGATETIELLNISGSEINDAEDRWSVVSSGFLADISAYTMVIEANVDSGNEDLYFDEMLIFTTE